MRKLISVTCSVTLLSMLTSFAFASNQAKSTATQTATTKDGRVVILNPDGTWKYAKEAETDIEKSRVSLEAAIIYRSGNVKPVARTEFHLLDQSLVQILRAAGLQPDRRWIQPQGDDEALVNTFAYAVTTSLIDPTFLSKALPALKPHIIQTVTTDFTGKASFDSIKAGSYFIVGIAQTATGSSGGHAVWNLKVDVKPGTSNVILDQNNAVYAR
jgi:hypothetical protein